MREEFGFKIAGVPVLLSFKQLDAAMRDQFEYEITHIDNRICQIFDLRQHGTGSYLGKMAVKDAVQKFG